MSIVSNHFPEVIEDLNERPLAWSRPPSFTELDLMYGQHLEARIRELIRTLEVEATDLFEISSQVGPDPFNEGQASALHRAASLLRRLLS
jgi:hypothetical protein